MGFTNKKYLCVCKIGFTGENCENDIDECSSSSHTCSEHATCTNTAGHFNCSCKPGYIGDGHLCLVFLECQGALGMANGSITDEQISASSVYNANHAAKQGRLYFQETQIKSGAWAAARNKLNQWLEIDLRDQHTIVTGVATQGRNYNNWPHGPHWQWVRKYKLQYSDDGVTFQYYREKGQSEDKEFVGNTDRDSVVYHELNPAITARYIRFRPTAWDKWIAMRVELYGCKGSYYSSYRMTQDYDQQKPSAHQRES